MMCLHMSDDDTITYVALFVLCFVLHVVLFVVDAHVFLCCACLCVLLLRLWVCSVCCL